MKKSIHLALILILHFSSKGQIACFTTTDTVGILPYSVTLTHCGDDSKPTIYDYGDGSPLTSSSTHTYTTAGYFDISQLVSNNPIIDTFKIDSAVRVVNGQPPIFTTNTCINRTVNIKCLDTGYDKYVIDYGDGSLFDTTVAEITKSHTYTDTLAKVITVEGIYSYATGGASSSKTIQPYEKLISPKTTQYKNLKDIELEFNCSGFNHLFYSYSIKNTLNNNIINQDSFVVSNSDTNITNNISGSGSYILSVVNLDYCGNSLNEDSYISIGLSTSAQNGKNTLTWNNNQNLISKFIIYKNNSPLDTVNTTINTYEDTDILCGKNYCYLIKAIHSNNYHQTISNESCVKSINNSTPPALDSTYSSFNKNNKLEISWKNPAQIDVSRYVIQDISSNSKLELSHPGNTPFLTTHKIGHCYNVYYYDVCGNKSELNSDTTCPIEMLVLKDEGNYQLINSPYKIHYGGTSNYNIEWLDTDFNLIKDVSNSLENEYLDLSPEQLPQRYYYRISAKPNNSSEPIIVSNHFLVEQWHLMLFPNAFSPNDDGINDTFKPKHNHINGFSITIYDSWGKLVYISTNINDGWDGSNNGKTQPPGSYQYQTVYQDQLGLEHKKSGTIKLIR